MDPAIHPLWRDVDTLAHRFVGFAHTLRFVPTNHPTINGTPEENRETIAAWYRDLARGPKDPIIPGDAIVIDGADVHVGYIGSNNAWGWALKGAVGAVTNGGCRDTDELIRQRIPVYSTRIEKTIRPFRLELESEQVTISCGGVMVRPGDVVVADGDGVVVVPIEIAADVAHWARVVANGDREGRRRYFRQAGLPTDETVAPLGQV